MYTAKQFLRKVSWCTTSMVISMAVQTGISITWLYLRYFDPDSKSLIFEITAGITKPLMIVTALVMLLTARAELISIQRSIRETLVRSDLPLAQSLSMWIKVFLIFRAATLVLTTLLIYLMSRLPTLVLFVCSVLHWIAFSAWHLRLAQLCGVVFASCSSEASENAIRQAAHNWRIVLVESIGLALLEGYSAVAPSEDVLFLHLLHPFWIMLLAFVLYALTHLLLLTRSMIRELDNP